MFRQRILTSSDTCKCNVIKTSYLVSLYVTFNDRKKTNSIRFCDHITIQITSLPQNRNNLAEELTGNFLAESTTTSSIATDNRSPDSFSRFA